MYRLWFFLTVCIYGILAFRIENEFEDLNDWMYHDDTATVNAAGEDQCKRDLLVILDLSFSIPKDSLDHDVKPFMKNLIESPILKVGPNGTHVGLIRFDKVTKLLFNIGDKSIAEMKEVIDGLQFDDQTGGQTRTNLALEKANEVFPLKNPENKRSDIYDAVILITDGAPRGERDSKTKTTKQAKILKDKNINITILAVGKDRFDFIPYMKEELATSPEHVFDAEFNETDEILGKLVSRSCGEPEKTGFCLCDGMPQVTRTIKSEKSKAKVSLPTPPTRCEEGAKIDEEMTEVNPPPPYEFSAGTHVVNYTFSVQEAIINELICPLKVKVKVKCGNRSYFPKKKACCCDELHRRQDGHECCGKNYYKKSEMICCGNGHLVPHGEPC